MAGADGIGDALVAGAEHQRLDQPVEDHRVGDAGPVAAQRMNSIPDRQQGQKLLAQRVKDARWDGRHERSTAHGASVPSRAWPACLPSSSATPDIVNGLLAGALTEGDRRCAFLQGRLIDQPPLPPGTSRSLSPPP